MLASPFRKMRWQPPQTLPARPLFKTALMPVCPGFHQNGAETSPHPTPAPMSTMAATRKISLFPSSVSCIVCQARWIGSLAVYCNGGMNTRYQDGIPLFNGGTTARTSISLQQLFITPSLTWQPDPGQAFGLGINLVYQRFRAEGLQNFSGDNKGTDHAYGIGARIGWMGTLTHHLRLGVTWSSKTASTKFDKYAAMFAEDGQYNIPENYGVGLAYKLSASLTLAADYMRIKYGSIKAIANPDGKLFSFQFE